MATLFPKLRTARKRLLHKLRFLYWRRLLRKAGFKVGLKERVLSISGLTKIDDLFPGIPAPLEKQDATGQWRAESPSRYLVYPQCSEEMRLPRTIEPDDAGNFTASRIIHRPPVYVYRIPEAFYHGELGAVLDEQYRAFSDLIDATPSYFPADKVKTEPHFSNGDALALSCSSNYYHWLIKMLPRLHLLEKVGMTATDFETIFVYCLSPIHEEAYALAGLPSKTLRVIGNSDFCFCHRLFASSVAHDAPLWAVNYVRSLFTSSIRPVANSPKAIYLTRENAGKRRVRNDDEVRDCLKKRGFQAIDLGQHSFEKQIQIMANADVIVAVHGAALANLVFAKNGARVLEIFANSQNQKCYWMLARHRQMIYHYFMSQSVPDGGNPNAFDLVIPIDKLERAVDLLMADNGDV